MKTNQYQPPFARSSQLQELARQQIGCVHNAERAVAKPPEPSSLDALQRYREMQADAAFQRRASGGKLPAAQEQKFAADLDDLWAKMSQADRAQADPARAALKVATPVVGELRSFEPPQKSPPPMRKIEVQPAPAPPVAPPEPAPAPAPEPILGVPEKVEEPAVPEAPQAAAPEAEAKDDGLESMTMSALENVARAEGITAKKGSSRATLVQAIRQKRGQA